MTNLLTRTEMVERKGRSQRNSTTSLNTATGCQALMLPELVTRAKSGDTGALNTLILRFQDMAVGLAASVLGGLGGMPDAEDVAQEAFVEALRRLPDLQHPAAFPSLLQSLVRKHADRITRRRQFRVVTLDDAGATATAASGDPAKELAVSEMREAVRQAVRDLPEAERTAWRTAVLCWRSVTEGNRRIARCPAFDREGASARRAHPTEKENVHHVRRKSQRGTALRDRGVPRERQARPSADPRLTVSYADAR